VQKLIDLFAPKLVLGISDEISSTGDIERVKIVGDLVEEYNSQFEQTSRLVVQSASSDTEWLRDRKGDKLCT
jgi:hypothetical protein